MTEALIFDFDGVILSSTEIKHDAYRTIFEGHDEETVEKFLEYHTINGGISRFVKIRYFYEELLSKEISEKEVLELADVFGQIMRKELTNKSYLINESVEFIKENHKNVPIHVASGAEEEELIFLCEKLGIKDLFVSINGSPTPKPEVVENIFKNYGYKADKTILIGDSINDYEAAIANKVHFFGYNNEDLKDLKNGGYIESFTEFSIS